MGVTRDDVINAFRLILGREPENEEVISQAMVAHDLSHLREAFLGSPEFISNYRAGPFSQLAIGRFLDATQVDVDIDCSQEQLQAMFDRIGAAWKIFGETEPHWSVLVSDDYRQENLADNIERFYASGVADIDVHFNFVRRAGLPTTFRRALDFGCGVGRLTLALAPHAQEVVGVDISPPHLALARERASAQAIDNVRFEAIDSVDTLDRYRDYDLVISRIVLQHNPPPVMAGLLRKLLRALAKGGVAIIQLPTFIPGQKFTAAEYLASDQPTMEMNALPQRVIFDIISETGCRAVEVREDPAAGNVGVSHSFAVQRYD